MVVRQGTALSLIAWMGIAACAGSIDDRPPSPARVGPEGPATAPDGGQVTRDAAQQTPPVAAADAGVAIDASPAEGAPETVVDPLARPPRPAFGAPPDSVLSQTIAAMKPGEWRELTNIGNLNGDLFRLDVNGDSGSTLNTDWSDNLNWDPGVQEVLYLGAGHLRAYKFIRYAAATNAWRGHDDIPDCMKVGGYGCFNHGYDMHAIDVAQGVYYFIDGSKTLRVFDLETDGWSTQAVSDSVRAGYGSAVEWFPEIQRLVVVQGGEVHLYDPRTEQPEAVATELDMGPYHNIGVYSDRFNLMFFGGGNGSAALWQMDTERTLTRIPDAPGVVHVSHSTLTTDPVTGSLLYLAEGSATLHEYDPARGSWQATGSPAPFTEHTLATPLDDHGAVFYLSPRLRKVFLYKHAE